MISNRHCRVYCLLSNTSNHNSNTNGPPEMEVFVEDASGNGTLVNGTTLLRRKLHTGDVICLLNPKLLAKKLRSVAERKMYMSQYSYVFVNLYEQEARHGWGVHSMGKTAGGAADLASPVSTAKKGAVNPRAIKCHSINNKKSKRSLFASTTGAEGATKSNNPPAQHSSQNNPPASDHSSTTPISPTPTNAASRKSTTCATSSEQAPAARSVGSSTIAPGMNAP